MICKNCGTEVEVKGRTTHYYEPVDKRLIASTHNIPFYCSLCGSIKFPYRAVRGVVFVWPFNRFGEQFRSKDSKVIIPEVAKKGAFSDLGIVLSAGPGFYDKKNKLKWRPVIGLSTGMLVVYDKDAPWGMDVRGTDGGLYYVKICDFTDVQVEVC